MTELTVNKSWAQRLEGFVWQHVLLCISLFVMTLGVALCLRSNLGSSVISTIPFVMSLAGESGQAPALTIGEYTYWMNFLLVGAQVLVLRKRFDLVQLFQLLIGFLFGFLLDINMSLTAPLFCDTLPLQIGVQLAGCAVLAFGISMEIRCGSVTMPGEGFPVAISRVTGAPFPKVKILVDISLVVIAIALGYIYFGTWQGHVVGVGTLVAMVLVGLLVKLYNPLMDWFDRLLHFRPHFRRRLYGLARFLYRKNN